MPLFVGEYLQKKQTTSTRSRNQDIDKNCIHPAPTTRPQPRSSKLPKSTAGPLAGENSRAGNGVGRRGRVVQVKHDAGVVGLVRAGEADAGRYAAAGAAGDVDLGALHVQLGAGVAAGAVQRDQLDPQQVLARRDALGDAEVDLALVRDQLVDRPRAGGALQAVRVDLEPRQARHGGRRGVVDLGQVRDDGPLVRGADRVVAVGGVEAGEGVVELGGHGGAGGDLGGWVSGLGLGFFGGGMCAG